MDWWSIKISGQSVAHVSREIEGRNDILATRIFKRTKTFVSDELWPVLSSIVDHHQDPRVRENILSDLELKILETIRSDVSIRTDRLREELKLEGKENNSRFHRSLITLESYAFIVGVEDPHPEKHLHANIWQTWERRTRQGKRLSDLPYNDALSKLLVKTVDACVLVLEDQMPGWFKWSSDMQEAKQQSLKDKTILKSGRFLVSTKTGMLTINDRPVSD